MDTSSNMLRYNDYRFHSKRNYSCAHDLIGKMILFSNHIVYKLCIKLGKVTVRYEFLKIGS